MDKSTAIILIFLGLCVFGLAYYQAYTYNAFGDHSKIELFIYHLCFDMFNLERNMDTVNSDVLNCQQAILLQQIKNFLMGEIDNDLNMVSTHGLL